MTDPFIEFEKIENFRTFGVPRMYRSAHPDLATDNDITKLSELNITDEVDFRTFEEIMFRSNRKGFQAAIAKRLRFLDLFAPKVGYKLPKETLLKALPPKFNGEINVKSVNIFNINYRKNAIWKRCNTRQKWSIAKYILTFDRNGLERFIGSQILAPRGLLGLYKDIIDFSGDSIRTALNAIMSALEKSSDVGGHVLINCSAGRDRTMMIVYMIRSIMDHKVEDIATDYSLSEKGLSRIMNQYILQLLDDGLTPEFASAPREVMLDLHCYICNVYNSVMGYLDSIKFGAEQRARLRELLRT